MKLVVFKLKNSKQTILNINYRVIDTVGIGDTQLTEEEVLNKIAEATYSVKNGLHQILFVTNSRFDEAETFAYDLLRKVIFDQDIEKYTTIIKTRFDHFENEKICQDDKQKLKKENAKLFNLVGKVNNIIHIDNPVIDINNPKDKERNQEKRKVSREKLLAHLANCQEVYKPKNLRTLNNKIDIFMKEKQELEQRITELNKTSKTFKTNTIIATLNQQVNTLEVNIQQETSQHIESHWPQWVDIATKVGSLVTSVASLVVAIACQIM